MQVLQGTVVSASPGLQGFDTNTVLTQATAAAFAQQGFQFCARYLSRTVPQAPGDLSSAEAAAILAGGLSLMPIQHVAEPGWVPSAALGTQYGSAAATNALAIGFPGGINVWLDLEGVQVGVEAADVVSYCNAWFNAVSAAGFVGGLYVGAGSLLSGNDLFWRLRTKHYWRSGSGVPDVEQRGYQLIQRVTASADVMNGIAIDRDLTQTDALGGAVLWLSP